MTRVEEPPVNAQGCMYTGKVVGDADSIVSLSLCHGLLHQLLVQLVSGCLITYDSESYRDVM
ncbi:unnamed protein product [Nezara viridula]|uniref:Peptidase M12B propeptide domain-containing protein n=1 Tax=Nezara viridula TaxID=85310 RepID=A0A9P0EBI0_NEZVI|nr:unnamed protein product [Nezara viridula]